MKEIKINQTSEGTVLLFSGNMDQAFPFPDPAAINHSIVVMDFSELKLIDSVGIRNFIFFMQALKADKLIYRNCPCLLVNQFNMVKSMVTSRVVVESFYAPYYAPISHEEIDLLITSKEVQRGVAPKRSHPKTGEILEFDDIDERYFFFLKNPS